MAGPALDGFIMHKARFTRFLNCIGGYTRSVDTYSFAAAEVAVPHILGNFYAYLAYATSWPSIIENTGLLVAFGGIPLNNGQINAGGIGRHIQRENLQTAHQAGVRFVNVGPVRTDIAEFVKAEWLAPRPNTDTAILLGIAHTLYQDNSYDQGFIDKYTHGFERFCAYLAGDTDGINKDAHWAASISGLEPQQITALARDMASNRTMISVSWSLSRQDHGEQTFWSAITVAAMLGQIGLPGGGIGFGYSATNSVGDHGTKIPGGLFAPRRKSRG